MNCEKCNELLDDFLDGVLNDAEHASLSAHMEECLECFHARNELEQILSFCRDHRGEYDAPPNERALWLRIRNTIESEQGTQSAAAAPAAVSKSARSRYNWWSRVMDRHWELTLPQLAAAVSVIAIAVALGTAFSLKQVGDSSSSSSASQAQSAAVSSRTQTSLQNARPFANNVDDRVRRQQVNIEYWSERVSQRKARWNPQMREAFDRNLSVLDQAVEESRQRLRINPHDEISEEMLNAALSDKMELLKEFSDQ